MIRLIAAVDDKLGIAKGGEMPWKIPEDEQYFTDQTKKYGANVLTGGATFREAYKSKPLAHRTNYLLTRDNTPVEGVILVHDLAKFLNEFGDKDLWVAGGGEVFKQIIDLNKEDELLITHITGDFACDRFFPDYQDKFKLKQRSEDMEQNGFKFYYATYRRKST